MECYAARPIPPFDGKTATEPKYRRCQKGAGVHSDKPGDQEVPPRRLVVRKDLLRKALAKEEKADHRPGKKNQRVGPEVAFSHICTRPVAYLKSVATGLGN